MGLIQCKTVDPSGRATQMLLESPIYGRKGQRDAMCLGWNPNPLEILLPLTSASGRAPGRPSSAAAALAGGTRWACHSVILGRCGTLRYSAARGSRNLCSQDLATSCSMSALLVAAAACSTDHGPGGSTSSQGWQSLVLREVFEV